MAFGKTCAIFEHDPTEAENDADRRTNVVGGHAHQMIFEFRDFHQLAMAVVGHDRESPGESQKPLVLPRNVVQFVA